MIKINSVLKVVDNSGARFAQCLRVLSKSPKNAAYIGDLIIVSVKRVVPNKKNKKRFYSYSSCRKNCKRNYTFRW